MVAIGKKIKELRISNKLTQKKLAETLHVTPQAVSKWERNESMPDIETLLKISTYFNISLDELFGRKSNHLLHTLFSKRKGHFTMDKQIIKENDSPLDKQAEKKVIIFDIVFSLIADNGLLQTQMLNRKLNLLAEQNKDYFIIETYDSSKVDQYGQIADLILLTPTFGYAQEDIQSKFPLTPVIQISKQTYGMLDINDLYEKIKQYLS